MVGSSSTASVSFERCMPSPVDPGDSCVTIPVPVDSATIDDPSVFALEDIGDAYRYTALAVGTANLTVVADGETFHRQLRAAVPDMVKADLTCWQDTWFWGDAGWTAKAFGMQSEVEVKYELFASDDTPFGTELSHDNDVVPLESPLLTLRDTPPVSSYDHAVFVTGDVAGTGVITSPFDPDVQIPVEVFSAAQASGFKLHLTGDAILLGTRKHASFESYLTVRNGEPTCMDHFARTVRTLTPATCMLWDWTQDLMSMAVNGRDQVIVDGIAVGTCTIEIALDGTTLTMQQNFPVDP